MPATLVVPQVGDIVKRTRRAPLPPDVRYIGRPTKYGNPYRVGEWLCQPTDDGADFVSVMIDLDLAVALFDVWARSSEDPGAVWIRENVAELVDRRLACWCPQPGPCHGHVLAAMALEAVGRPVPGPATVTPLALGLATELRAARSLLRALDLDDLVEQAQPDGRYVFAQGVAGGRDLDAAETALVLDMEAEDIAAIDPPPADQLPLVP